MSKQSKKKSENLTIESLLEQHQVALKELVDLKIKNVMGQLKNVRKPKEVRKQIARIKTQIRFQQLLKIEENKVGETKKMDKVVEKDNK